MSHYHDFGMVHSLDDRGLPNMFGDPLQSYGGGHTPVAFEFDNFGISHQPTNTTIPSVSQSVGDSALSAPVQETTGLPTTLSQSQTLYNSGNMHNIGNQSLHNLESQNQDVIPKTEVTDVIKTEPLPLEHEYVKVEQTPETSESADNPVIDIAINNVVCSFATRCHLNLRRIAMDGMNVIHKKEFGMVSMKLRDPYTTASIWSSGKITCTGATSEEESKRAARRFARTLQNLGFKTKVANFRVVNVLGTCHMPFAINIAAFSQQHPRQASYEPELHPGVTYKLVEPKATLKVFSTGSITVTAPRVINVQMAIEHIFPLVYSHRKNRGTLGNDDFKKAEMYTVPANRRKRQVEERQKHLIRKRQRFDDSDEEDWTDTSDEFDSDDSEYQ